jgi:radical SAM protein with 4Fe4S-binding SPASM domain
MANILLTQKCVRSCPYCFAKKHMADAEPDDTLTWDNLIYITDLLEHSHEMGISLLGGEPTLHPHFVDIVLYLLERNFHVNVFTSGIMSEKMFSEMERNLSAIPPDRLSFVCNVNDPEKTSFSELETVRRFLKAFGHLTTAGFNIYKPDFKFEFLFQYINEFGLHRHLRLGLAHPIPGKQNMYVPIDKMPQMAEHLISYLPQLERMKVKAGFDCGFPLCIFSEEQVGKLYMHNKGHLSFGCGPAVDIGPDMTVWGCFPLSNIHKKSLFDFDSMQDIRRFYLEIHQKVRIEVAGIYEKCDECLYREEGLCMGGCLAHSYNHFMKEPEVRHKGLF